MPCHFVGHIDIGTIVGAPKLSDVQFHIHQLVVRSLGGIPKYIVVYGAFLEIVDSRIPEKCGKALSLQSKIVQVKLFPLPYKTPVCRFFVNGIQFWGSDVFLYRVHNVGLVQSNTVCYLRFFCVFTFNYLILPGVVKITLAIVVRFELAYGFVGFGGRSFPFCTVCIFLISKVSLE